MTRPKFSVIIINYCSGLLTKACIASVRRARPPEPYEIFVVDNASKDDSREILTTDIAGIRTHFSSRNLGFARAMNLALRETSGEYALLLNPDVIVLTGALRALLAFMETHPRVGISAGQLVNPNGTVQESASRFYTPQTILYRRTALGRLPWARRHLDRIFMRDVDLANPQPIDWAIGACLCVRRSAMEEVGPMDERFFLYFEDMDWCRRFWRAGWGIWYVPAARFAHYHKRESAQERGLLALFHPVARIHIASGVKYLWKYRGGVAPRPARAPAPASGGAPSP